jgi:hypothetical protein
MGHNAITHKGEFVMEKTPEFADTEVPITVVDNLCAPDVLADAMIGAFLTNGNVHMTLVARRCDYSKHPNIFSDVVIGRLVMPFAAAENMAKFIGDFTKRMKEIPAHLTADTPTILQ